MRPFTFILPECQFAVGSILDSRTKKRSHAASVQREGTRSEISSQSKTPSGPFILRRGSGAQDTEGLTSLPPCRPAVGSIHDSRTKKEAPAMELMSGDACLSANEHALCNRRHSAASVLAGP